MTAKFKDVIAERPMTAFQWRAVALCVLLNVLDGFDVLVMAFTGRAVSAEWGLTATQLGLLLSAGLVGMGIGSLFVAPWADRLGRRPVTLACMVVITVGMLLSAASQSAGQLGAFRVLTGIGIGGILATSIVIASEYSSRRWRGLAVSLNSAGYAIGATVGGLLAVLLIDQFGWRTVFLVGGLLSVAALPLIWWGFRSPSTSSRPGSRDVRWSARTRSWSGWGTTRWTRSHRRTAATAASPRDSAGWSRPGCAATPCSSAAPTSACWPVSTSSRAGPRASLSTRACPLPPGSAAARC